MSFPFGDRSERTYAHQAVERFPWPVVAGYDDVHRWMDAGLVVNAAWQVRDCWEALLKFLGSLAVMDRLASSSLDDSRLGKLLATLLNPRGLSLGHWPQLMDLALRDSTASTRLPQ